MAMKRYHPLLVSLHWILAALILFSLYTGNNILEEMSNASPEKIFVLKVHMATGLVILALMLFRLIVRLKSQLPKKIDTGNAFINKAGKYSHILLYVLVFLITISGLSTSILADLPNIFATGGVLPETFENLPPRIAHGVLTKILFALVILHLSASLYHQFIRKDSLLSRMWFGKS